MVEKVLQEENKLVKRQTIREPDRNRPKAYQHSTEIVNGEKIQICFGEDRRVFNKIKDAYEQRVCHLTASPQFKFNEKSGIMQRELYPQSLWQPKSFPINRETIMLQLAQFLIESVYLGIAHRDLHTKNIYFDRNGNLKVCDWETVEMVEPKEQVTLADVINCYDFCGDGPNHPELDTMQMNLFHKNKASCAKKIRFDQKEFIPYVSYLLLHKYDFGCVLNS